MHGMRALCQISGFYRAFLSVREALLQMLELIFATVDQSSEMITTGNTFAGGGSTSPSQYHGWDIHITGHSLGGALASLFAFELGLIRSRQITTTASLKLQETIHRANVSMYSYGAPRVGNQPFVEVSPFELFTPYKPVTCFLTLTSRADVQPTSTRQLPTGQS